MIRLILYFLLLMPISAQARSYLNLDEFSLKLARFDCNRELQTPEILCSDYIGRVATEFDLSIIDDLIYWRNEVHGEGTSAKFMTVGWHWDLGIKLGNVELFWEHHSRHVMDQGQPYYWDEKLQSPQRIKYPVEDSYGVRIVFYKRGE